MSHKKFKTSRNKKRFKFNWSLFNKFLILLFIVISIGYVVSINDLAIKGFVLNELKAETRELSEKNKNFELKIAELENYENINIRAQGMKMVKADNVEYITVINETVAKR